ncbi:histidine kinase [uncultured Methylobacterium sp.]|uniref:histidine kinase n=1 Tax=uncultured Methylobacterium sp. TaxID=157278 RepID=UPI0035CA9399
MPQPVFGSAVVSPTAPLGGCYGVQVLVAGRQKRWRDEVSSQVRRAGYQATACDSAVDALTVLVLGLPVDVLVADVALQGALCCSRLAREARALRPGLRIVLASEFYEDMAGAASDLLPDTILIPRDLRDGAVASTVREALASRTA